MITPEIQRQIEQVELAKPQAISTVSPGVYLGGALLPASADDLTAAQGLHVYKRMESESAIASSDFILRALTLECGWKTGTAVEEPQDKKSRKREDVQARKDYEQAEKIRLYIQRMLDRLETPFEDILYTSLEAWLDGHKLFEKVRVIITDDDGSRIAAVIDIKPKPRTGYQFAVTRNMDVVGVVPTRNGGALFWDFPNKATADEKDKLVPPEDVIVVTSRGVDGDPRGQAAKRAAYDPWLRKQEAKPQQVKHATLFGSVRQSIEIPLSESIDKVPNELTIDGQKIGIVDYMMKSVMPALISSGIVTLPQGWTLKTHNPAGEGEVFERIFDRCDREMIQAILTVTRATTEAQHGSKADSQTAEGMLAGLVNWLRQLLCAAFEKWLFKPEVALQFGEEAARKFTPKLLMEVTDEEDIPGLLMAVARSYEAGTTTPEQLPYWDRVLGQPERDVTDTLRQPNADQKAAIDQTAAATEQNPADVAMSFGFSYPEKEDGPEEGPTFRRRSKNKKAHSKHLQKSDSDQTQPS